MIKSDMDSEGSPRERGLCHVKPFAFMTSGFWSNKWLLGPMVLKWSAGAYATRMWAAQQPRTIVRCSSKLVRLGVAHRIFLLGIALTVKRTRIPPNFLVCRKRLLCVGKR